MIKKYLLRVASLKEDRRGSIFFETILKILIVVIIMLTAINLFDVVIKYQHVSYASKSIAKTVELEGALNHMAYDKLDALNSNFNMDMEFNIQDVSYFDLASRAIQFRENFVIEVTYNYNFVLFTPIFSSSPVSIDIPMRATCSGMSEVYWKT